MKYVHCATLCGALALVISCGYAAPLDPYLLRPEDRPPECRAASGLYAVNPKVALFYDYKVYRVALPPVIERHAQSLECGPPSNGEPRPKGGTQKGTLYFFAYQDAAQAEMAERFARSVLTGPTPSLGIESFPKGFVILSFPELPESVRAALSRKIQPPDHIESVVSPSSPSAIAPEPAVISTPVAVAPSSAANPVLPPTPVVLPQPPSAPPVPAPTPVSPGPEPDLSDDILRKLQKALECKSNGLEPDVREACKLIQAFKTGKPVDLIIAAPSARVGLAFRITDLGQLRSSFYDVAVGSGQKGEIAIYPLLTETGVQEIEAKALVEDRRAGKGLPAGNELTDRIAKMVRPNRPTALPTLGRSQVLRLGGGRRVYIRRSGEQWVLVSVNPNPADLLDPTDVVIAGLY